MAYARCFGADGGSGLSADDIQNLSLQGTVMKFHKWVIAESDKLTEHQADPFEAAKIGAALAPAGQKEQRVASIAVYSTSRVLIDATGVRQLGALASELAKQTAIKAQKQQDSVLSEAQQLDLAALRELPPLHTEEPATEATP